MNILFVAPFPMAASIGGIQRVSCVLAKEMLHHGHNIFFLYSSYKDDLELSEYKGLHYHVPIDLKSLDKSIPLYHELLKKLMIDCVIFQWVEEGTTVWLQNTPRTIKTIAVIHQQPFAGYGYERLVNKHMRINGIRTFVIKSLCMICPIVMRNYSSKIMEKLLQTCIIHADIICLLSERFISRIERISPKVKTEKFKAINNPLTFVPKTNIDFNKKENIILFVGRIENESKNIYGFVDIWQRLSKDNLDWKAVVVGDGIDLKDVKQYAIDKFVPRIEFAGRRKDVSPYYKRAKILAVTSFGESWSMVLTEGMSFGCVPCVFDSYEALYDIVDDKKNGLIIPAFNNAAFVEGVQKLINDKHMRENMAHEAMLKVQEFTPDKIVPQWISLINSINK